MPLDSFPPDAASGFACESKEKAFFGALSLKQLESKILHSQDNSRIMFKS